MQNHSAQLVLKHCLDDLGGRRNETAGMDRTARQRSCATLSFAQPDISVPRSPHAGRSSEKQKLRSIRLSQASRRREYRALWLRSTPSTRRADSVKFRGASRPCLTPSTSRISCGSWSCRPPGMRTLLARPLTRARSFAASFSSRVAKVATCGKCCYSYDVRFGEHSQCHGRYCAHRRLHRRCVADDDRNYGRNFCSGRTTLFLPTPVWRDCRDNHGRLSPHCHWIRNSTGLGRWSSMAIRDVAT